MKGTTQFWDAPEGRWQDFRWCPDCGTEPIHGNSERCPSCAATKREEPKWKARDDLRYVRHLIRAFWTQGEG